jgi:hypothetical protein
MPRVLNAKKLSELVIFLGERVILKSKKQELSKRNNERMKLLKTGAKGGIRGRAIYDIASAWNS